MSITTKRGDSGETNLLTGEKISKSNIKVDSYGTGDELVSFLGFLKHDVKYFYNLIEWMQIKIYKINAFLAAGDEDAKKTAAADFHKDKNFELDEVLSNLENEYGKITEFIIPSETPSASKADICRSICRRFERRVVQLSDYEKIDKGILIFINRMSDVLFMMARVIGKREGGRIYGFKRENT